MRIGILGINHKLAELRLRELLAKACQRRFAAHCSMHGDKQFVLLSTCNRTEIYFGSEDLADTHTYILNILKQEVQKEFDQKIYSYFGIDCFHHLCRVTAGLDSAILGETEIQGQVKNAYEHASEYLSLSRDIHYVFQKSLKIGKKVRTELPIQKGVPSLEHGVYNIGSHMFKNAKLVKILFVGASDINEKIISFFQKRKEHQITLCNRSEEVAETLAQKYQLDLLPWEMLPRWPAFDWIIFGTKSPNHLIDRTGLPCDFSSKKLVMDLSVPRNVDPNISLDPRITLLNIDQINRTLSYRQNHMSNIFEMAENLIRESTLQHMELFHRKLNLNLLDKKVNGL